MTSSHRTNQFYINRKVDKKVLSKLTAQFFTYFGALKALSLLENFKNIGFRYATNAGISLALEDLKIPPDKQFWINDTEDKIIKTNSSWQIGKLTDIERFEYIIGLWSRTSEILKNRIIDFFQTSDPLNSIYMISFSGARGNLSQVRQLIGMRGLMTNQKGQIIDLPITKNFREGLDSVDFIISSYGARKGVVDTALRTADSGYLTRRLVEVGQYVIINEIDCKTKNGIKIKLKDSKSFFNSLQGRALATDFNSQIPFSQSISRNTLINNQLITYFKKLYDNNHISYLSIRSSLTCNSYRSICQYCYGWDLARQNLVDLGEAVGILAGQSIGEPGTQMTMRTFHTGGVFDSEFIEVLSAQSSGILKYVGEGLGVIKRTLEGQIVFQVISPFYIRIIDWKNDYQEIWMPEGSLLLKKENEYIKKGDPLIEISNVGQFEGKRQFKALLSPIDGELSCSNLFIKSQRIKDSIVNFNKHSNQIWLFPGKILSFPKNIKLFLNSLNFNSNRPLGEIFFSPIFPDIGEVEYYLSKITENNFFQTSGSIQLSYRDFCLEKKFFKKSNILLKKYIRKKENKSLKLFRISFSFGEFNVLLNNNKNIYNFYYSSKKNNLLFLSELNRRIKFFKKNLRLIKNISSKKKNSNFRNCSYSYFSPSNLFLNSILDKFSIVEDLSSFSDKYFYSDLRPDLYFGRDENIKEFKYSLNNLSFLVPNKPFCFKFYSQKLIKKSKSRIFLPGEPISPFLLTKTLSFVLIFPLKKLKQKNLNIVLIFPLFEFQTFKPWLTLAAATKFYSSSFRCYSWFPHFLYCHARILSIIAITILNQSYEFEINDTRNKLIQKNLLLNITNKDFYTYDKIEFPINSFRILSPSCDNTKTSVNLSFHDYQFIDSYTKISAYSYFLKNVHNSLLIRGSNTKQNKSLLLVDKNETSNIYFEKKNLITQRFYPKFTPLSKNFYCAHSTIEINYKSNKLTLRKAIPFFLTSGAIVQFFDNNFLKKGDTLGIILDYKKQANDITQGLPKIEELFEVRGRYRYAYLVQNSGIVRSITAGFYEKKGYHSFNYYSTINKKAINLSKILTFESIDKSFFKKSNQKKSKEKRKKKKKKKKI